MSNDPGTRHGEIRTEARDGVGWVTIARPQKRNALTVAMWTAIPAAMQSLSEREDLVAIFLQGADGNFGAGADLEDVARAGESRSLADDYCGDVVRALLAIATVPLPTVALVQGVAAGGGAELAIACDVRLAEPTASFSFPFARLGIVPDAFTLARLKDLVGASTARRLVFTGETVDASRAHDLGLVDEVTRTDPGALLAAAESWAATLRTGSRSARREMKRVLMEPEARLDVGVLTTPMVGSFVAGEVRAVALRFLAKRSP